VLARVWPLLISVAIFLAPCVSAQELPKENLKPTPTSAQGSATSGKELFHQHCASCHFTETTAQKIGPGLKSLYARLKFSNGNKVTDASLARWIETGGKNMPGFKDAIKPGQIRELISYIKTL
jgi:cytochrome c